MSKISNTKIGKFTLKEEYITIGPYTLDIGRLIRWTLDKQGIQSAQRHSISLCFVGSNQMDIYSIDDIEDERQYRSSDGQVSYGLLEERFNSLVTYLESRFKPTKIENNEINKGERLAYQ